MFSREGTGLATNLFMILFYTASTQRARKGDARVTCDIAVTVSVIRR